MIEILESVIPEKWKGLRVEIALERTLAGVGTDLSRSGRSNPGYLEE